MNNIDAIQILSSYGVPQDEEQFREALDLAIKALEQSEWIPVSSGNFPKEHQECLFWDEDLGLGYGGYFTTSRGIGCFWDDTRGSDAKNVIAWMPLPEPYKGDTE